MRNQLQKEEMPTCSCISLVISIYLVTYQVGKPSVHLGRRAVQIQICKASPEKTAEGESQPWTTSRVFVSKVRMDDMELRHM